MHKTNDPQNILLSFQRFYVALLLLTSLLLLHLKGRLRQIVLRPFFHHWLTLRWQEEGNKTGVAGITMQIPGHGSKETVTGATRTLSQQLAKGQTLVLVIGPDSMTVSFQSHWARSFIFHSQGQNLFAVSLRMKASLGVPGLWLQVSEEGIPQSSSWFFFFFPPYPEALIFSCLFSLFTNFFYKVRSGKSLTI